MVSEDSEANFAPAFPADCPHRARCHRSSRSVAPDTRGFQHIAEFDLERYRSRAATCLRPPFTGASVQSFALRLTPLLNLPAPGRRQTLYLLLRVGRVLCF